MTFEILTSHYLYSVLCLRSNSSYEYINRHSSYVMTYLCSFSLLSMDSLSSSLCYLHFFHDLLFKKDLFVRISPSRCSVKTFMTFHCNLIKMFLQCHGTQTSHSGLLLTYLLRHNTCQYGNPPLHSFWIPSNYPDTEGCRTDNTLEVDEQ